MDEGESERISSVSEHGLQGSYKKKMVGPVGTNCTGSLWIDCRLGLQFALPLYNYTSLHVPFLENSEDVHVCVLSIEIVNERSQRKCTCKEGSENEANF